MNQKKAKLTTPIPDDAIRAGDFQLLPTINRPPVITSHPARNFSQNTWGALVLDNGKYSVKYNDVNSFNGVFTVRIGTACSWGLYCSDPSNLNNPNDTSNITFVWKRDSFPLHKINRQNNGYGTPFMSFTKEECVQGIDGVYVCELTNRHGTTTSVPFTLRVVDLDNDERLYTNLLLNGDAEGGMDEWINTDGLVRGVTSRTSGISFSANTLTGYPRGSLPYGTGADYQAPLEFRFNTKVNKWHLFYGLYNTWYSNTGGANGTLLNYEIPTIDVIKELPEWLQYTNTDLRSQVIANEEYNYSSDQPQGFFPAPNYIDKYNRNKNNSVKLSTEFSIAKSRPLNYFTRNTIKFEDPTTTHLDQIIELDGLESLIDGQVGGVSYLSAQFFSYVAIAISRYTIRATINGKLEEFNWFVHKLDTMRSFFSGKSLTRYIPDDFTDIEITPHADDTTTISIDVLNKQNEVLSTKTFEGPKALDIWAVKDKTDWSTSLYGIVQFFAQKNNPIKVFGQTYVRSSEIPKLYDQVTSNAGNLATSNLDEQANGTSDQNAKFVFKRMGGLYAKWNKPFPRTDAWMNDHPNGSNGYLPSQDASSRVEKAYVDRGAEAFMAVGGDITLPSKAVRLRVRVQFTNTSPAREDTNPSNKDWKRPDIYNTLYRIKPGGIETTPDGLDADAVPRPYFAYGPPRCGITKMKLLLVPNADVASEKHTTFAIPDPRFTIAGVARDLALKPVWDTSLDSKFTYKLISPEGGMVSPEPSTTLIDQQIIQNAQQGYNNSLIPNNDLGEFAFEEALRKDSIDRDNETTQSIIGSIDPQSNEESFDSGSIDTEQKR